MNRQRQPLNRKHQGTTSSMPACVRDFAAGTSVTSTYSPLLVTEEKEGWPVG